MTAQPGYPAPGEKPPQTFAVPDAGTWPPKRPVGPRDYVYLLLAIDLAAVGSLVASVMLGAGPSFCISMAMFFVTWSLLQMWYTR